VGAPSVRAGPRVALSEGREQPCLRDGSRGTALPTDCGGIVAHAELEIALRWRPDDVFDVDLAYNDPSDSQDRRDYVDEPLRIDTSALADLVAGHDEYGQALGEMLLNAPKVRSFYHKALATAADRDIPLHFRLVIDPRAPQRYHAVRWEAIRDPDEGFRIATQHHVLLSRYLSTPKWRRARPPQSHRLKALITIANPSDLSGYTRIGMPGVPLQPVDVDGEIERARTALTGMEVRELAGAGNATVGRIIEALRDGTDVFYLVCHGGMDRDEPRLYLEDEQGRAQVVRGSIIADRIAELELPPTVAVLCSCQSAGKGDEAMTWDAGALSSLAPRLARAGVAAVVGMQGNITMQTASIFLPAFFAELGKSGVVDRAVAVARSCVSDRERDWWMPVLFTRLRLGRAWYRPEVGAGNLIRLALADVAAMVFVDILRLTSVAGSDAARRVNEARYGEFVDVADLHMQEFRAQVTRLIREDDTGTEVGQSCADIESRFGWAITRLRRGPRLDRSWFDSLAALHETAEAVHNLENLIAIEYYQEKQDEISLVLRGILMPAARETRMSADDFVRRRLAAQRRALELMGTPDRVPATIRDDVHQYLAIPYFTIDLALIRQAVKL
jgi:CHAT domain